jgi:hypothetical protein
MRSSPLSGRRKEKRVPPSAANSRGTCRLRVSSTPISSTGWPSSSIFQVLQSIPPIRETSDVAPSSPHAGSIRPGAFRPSWLRLVAARWSTPYRQAGWPTVTVHNHLDVQPADGDGWRADPLQFSKTPVRSASSAVGRPTMKAGPRQTPSSSRAHHLGDRADVRALRPACAAYNLLRLTLRTATTDLHSLITGGVVCNPLAELLHVVAECVDGATGEVLVPGFYDEVEPLTSHEEGDVQARSQDRFVARDRSVGSDAAVVGRPVRSTGLWWRHRARYQGRDSAGSRSEAVGVDWCPT